MDGVSHHTPTIQPMQFLFLTNAITYTEMIFVQVVMLQILVSTALLLGVYGCCSLSQRKAFEMIYVKLQFM